LLEDPLQLLPSAPQAAVDSSGKEGDPLCLDNTRVEVRQQIRTWADGEDKSHIFWLSGWAGTGKSTIARTVAYEYRDRGSLGASFFFSRGKEDVSHAGKFFTSIAVQLAQYSAVLGDLIRKAISDNPNVASKVQQDQWKLLILEPLSKLESGSLQQPLIIVIDALDECDGDEDIQRILDLLSKAAVLKTIRLRIFVTSRPEIPIRLGFREMPGILHQDLILHGIPRASVNEDILTFFKDKFEVIRKKSEDDLPLDWPGKKCVDKLVVTAHGLFIYAATVCRFIEEGIKDFPADDLLRHILPNENIANTSSQMSRNITIHESPTMELDTLYIQVLEQSLKDVRHEKDKELLAGISRQVVGTIVILFDPLSPMAIARLLNMDGVVVKKRLNHLRSVLEAPDSQQPVRLLHPSFRDFLLDGKRCSNEQFLVDKRETHEMLATKCLELMSRPKCLGKNICHLESHGTLRSGINSRIIDDCLPADVRYACRYWIHHFEQSGRRIRDQDAVHIFLQEHFLHWLEVLSLIGVMSESIRLIGTLQSLVAVSIYNIVYLFAYLYQHESLER